MERGEQRTQAERELNSGLVHPIPPGVIEGTKPMKKMDVCGTVI